MLLSPGDNRTFGLNIVGRQMASGTEDIGRDAWRWFIGAGACAVIVSIALYQIDSYRSTNTLEERHAAELHELRAAQYSFQSSASDPRTGGSNRRGAE